MYTGLLHIHKLTVIIFVLIYLIKIILLLSNRNTILKHFSKKIKVIEIIVSCLFLLTGLIMLFSTPKVTPYQIAKIILILAAIPLAVIGFKKMNKWIASIAFLFIVATYFLGAYSKQFFARKKAIPKDIITESNIENYDFFLHGKAIYQVQCAICHGSKKSDKKFSGAKDLSISRKNKHEIKKLLKKGKNSMPSYEGIFTQQEIEAITAYVLKLRNNEEKTIIY